MTARGKARKRALDVLFEADQRGLNPREVLRVKQTAPDAAFNPYTVVIVEGVCDNRARIDELLGTYAVGWSLDRMPAVDRAILRVGVFELLWSDEVPDAVAVDEAVELARSLSTDDSPGFVNGLLGRIIELKPMLGFTA
jgi:transcription antitermination protein NusB